MLLSVAVPSRSGSAGAMHPADRVSASAHRALRQRLSFRVRRLIGLCVSVLSFRGGFFHQRLAFNLGRPRQF